jgi:hypothetical protein
VSFLSQNNFYPKREDLEAILRRVDHSGDHLISFDEFNEITGFNDKSAN